MGKASNFQKSHEINIVWPAELQILSPGPSCSMRIPLGAPLACDAIMVSPLHTGGSPRPRAKAEDGVALAHAEERQRAT